MADAVRADGWKGLYRGLVPNLVGGAGSWGCYILLYVGPHSEEYILTYKLQHDQTEDARR
jgi:hypothetical protein